MSLTISSALVDALIADPTSISGYSASSAIIIDGAISHTKASELNGVDATYIQATIETTSASNLAAIEDDNATRAQTNKFAFVINDASATAVELNNVLDKTSLSADFTSINDIESSAAIDILALYDSDLTSGLGDETITVSDDAVSAERLNQINGVTTADITIEATSITGETDDLITALGNADAGDVADNAAALATPLTGDSTKINGLDDIDVTVTSATGTIDAGELNSVVDLIEVDLSLIHI